MKKTCKHCEHAHGSIHEACSERYNDDPCKDFKEIPMKKWGLHKNETESNDDKQRIG